MRAGGRGRSDWIPRKDSVVPAGPLHSCCLQSTGLRFFPQYLSDQRRAALDDAALEVQRIGYATLRQLKPGPSPPLLLPAPEEAAGGGGGDGSVGGDSAAQLQLALPATDQRLSLGAIHVCEHTECRLPAERFWEASKGSVGGSGSEGGGSSRALQGTSSAP